MISIHKTSPGWIKPLLILLPLIVLLIPQVYAKSSALSFLSQVAIISVFALSYNILLGQTGLLSFGHAVYAGLGGYCAIHLLNNTGADGLGLGILALPLVAGLGGGVAGFIFGYVSTRRAGTTYAMITLGIAEMLVALALMLPGMSGGESGMTTNRMLNHAIFGINLGSDTQMYYFAWGWMLIATGLMYAFTKTPLGRLANAVRDNPERVAFIGFNPQKIRWAVMVIAGIFAGIAGGLSALNYELVTIENLGVAQSGMVLVASYLGGVGYFLGPVVGALIYVLLLTVISTMTKAWLLYFGVLFIAVVMFTPEGLLGLLKPSDGTPRFTLRRFLGMLLICACFIVAVETLYAYQDSIEMGQAASIRSLLGISKHAYLPIALLALAYVIAAAVKRLAAMQTNVGPGAANQLAGEKHGNK